MVNCRVHTLELSPPPDPMELDVHFFASYRDLVGTPRLQVTLPADATVADLVAAVRGQGEDFNRIPSRPAVAVNRAVAVPEQRLSAGDEVAFLPPVAGG